MGLLRWALQGARKNRSEEAACHADAHSDGGHSLPASTAVHAVEGEGEVGALEPQLQQILQDQLGAEEEHGSDLSLRLFDDLATDVFPQIGPLSRECLSAPVPSRCR